MTNSKALSRGQEEGQALSLKHIFGVNASASGSTIGYTDDTSAVYVAGRTLILYNTADNRQKVLTQGTYITALAFTRNRKYTAVAFDNSPHTGAPTVVVYETSSFRRKRQLSYPDMHSRRIISMAFSLDGRILVVQGGAPDYKLIMWSLDTKAARGTPLAVAHVSSSEKEPIHQVSVNPRDSTQVCVSGNGVVKFLRYTDGALKPVTTAPPKMREAYNYLCHAWMPMAHFTGESGTEDGTPRVVMGTETGELVLFENYEMKTVLPESPADNLAIYALEPTGKGFLCAGEKGIVSWYQSRYLTDASESSGTEGTMGKDQVYRRQRCLKVDTDRRSEEKMTPLETEDTTVRGMAVSPGEETVMLVTERGQIHTLNLSSSSAADLLPTQDEFYFDLMAGPFHVGGVTDIDACVRKPFLVTCGRDRTVRLWNYREHTAEHVQEFHVEPLTVTIHPSGMYVVVGFADKVRFMSVVGHYELVEVKALSIRNSSRCRFAHGGHMFAAVHGNVVQIYDTYTLRSVATLRGHSSRVRHVYWLRGDGGLVSMSIDGSVFEWRIEFPSLGIDASSSSSSSSSALASASSPGSIMGESKAVRVGEMAVKRQQTTAVHGSIGTGGGGSTTRTGDGGEEPPCGYVCVGMADGRILEFQKGQQKREVMCGRRDVERKRGGGGGSTTRTGDDSGGTIGMRTGTGTDAGTKHVSAVLVSVQQGVVTVGLGDGGIDVVSVAGRKASDAGHYNRRGHGNKDHDDDGGGGRGNDNDNNNNNNNNNDGDNNDNDEGGEHYDGEGSKERVRIREGGRGKGGERSNRPSSSSSVSSSLASPSVSSKGSLPSMILQQTWIHSGAVTGLATTIDEDQVFSVGEDGCVCIYDLNPSASISGTLPSSSVSGGGGTTTSKTPQRWSTTTTTTTTTTSGTSAYGRIGSHTGTSMGDDEVLLRLSDLQDKNQLISELRTKVEELKADNQYELRRKELEFDKKRQNITDQFKQELEEKRQKLEQTETSYETKIEEMEERMTKEQQNHENKLKTMEDESNQKLFAAKEETRKIQKEKKEQEAAHMQEMGELQSANMRSMEEQKEKYEEELQQMEEARDQLAIEKESVERESEELKRQMEEDMERELELLKEKYDSQLKSEREKITQLKGSYRFMENNKDELNREIEQYKKKMDEERQKTREMKERNQNLQQEIVALKQGITERDHTIANKEQRISSMNKSNQELEKFKFVLEYKISELKNNVEPRKETIANMQKQIGEMNAELERYDKKNANLKQEVSSLSLRVQGQKKEIQQLNTKLQDAQVYQDRIQSDIQQLIKFIQNPKQLKEQVKLIYNKHVTENVVQENVEEDMKQEYGRQREYLEKTVESLKKKLYKDTEAHKTDLKRIMNENVALISEINELRRENKSLRAENNNQENIKRDDKQKEIEIQRAEIQRLRDKLNSREERKSNRPISREQLPPMDGFE